MIRTGLHGHNGPGVIGVSAMGSSIGAAAPPWWDPGNEGLAVVGAYRAINSVGTPWTGGPTAYAQSLVNQSNPGTNDLTEGLGAVPWAQATGWGFVRAQSKYFDTGLIPANDQSWTVLCQYNNSENRNFAYLLGAQNGANRFFLLAPSTINSVRYYNGNVVAIAPVHLTGNLGISGNQGYRDGIANGGLIGVWVGASVASIYIGTSNNSGVPNGFLTVDIEAVVLYNAALTAPQMLAVATAMAAL